MKSKNTKFRAAPAAPKPSFLKQNSALLGVGAAIVTSVIVLNPFGGPGHVRISDVREYVAQGLAGPLEAFRESTGSYPGTAQGLKVLIARPTDSAAWSGPYIKEDSVPKDPWGSPYQYAYPGHHNGAKKYDVWSKGPDKKTGTPDDIGNW